LDLASGEWSHRPPTLYTDRIYAAGAQDLIDAAAEAEPQCHCQLLVSHNPACADAALTIAGREGPLAAAVQRKFPTAAIAVIEVPDWSQLRPGIGTLIDLAVPRG
jgi:phosphohistidine phosphatase